MAGLLGASMLLYTVCPYEGKTVENVSQIPLTVELFIHNSIPVRDPRSINSSTSKVSGQQPTDLLKIELFRIEIDALTWLLHLNLCQNVCNEIL